MAKDNPEKVAEQAVDEAQKTVDEENEKGYRGVSTDPTPRENYTVAGVTSGAPTPETDEGLADEVRRTLVRGV